jgi:hypothetical protein
LSFDEVFMSGCTAVIRFVIAEKKNRLLPEWPFVYLSCRLLPVSSVHAFC